MKAASINSNEPEEIYKIVNKELTKAKYASFGKVKVNSKSKEQKKLEPFERKK